MIPLSLSRRDLQIVEVRQRISFCPQSDLTWIFERVVRRFDLLGAVVVTNDLVSDTFDAQLMPLPRSNFEIRTCKLTAVPRDNVIEPVVVLQCVGSDDVVVTCVLQSEHQSSSAVHFAGNSFESHGEFKVFEAAFVRNEKRKAIVGRIRRGLPNYLG